MKNLIVYCHPNPSSFNHAILETTESTLREMGQELRTRNLYEMKWNPVLDATDFETFQSGSTPADIETEQNEIRWADRIIFIYPIWWTGMPARMKGFIDRVFSYGFAYEFRNGDDIGLLTGKEATVINTTGTPSEQFSRLGLPELFQKTVDRAIFEFCGMKVIDHVLFGAVPHVSDQVRQGYLQELKTRIQKFS